MACRVCRSGIIGYHAAIIVAVVTLWACTVKEAKVINMHTLPFNAPFITITLKTITGMI